MLLFASSFAHQWMLPNESLLVNKGMGRGSSWSSLDLETLESDVSSRRSAGAIDKDRGVAKKQCSSTCCGNQARRPVSTLCRLEPTAFDARALGRDPRVHRGGTWANFKEKTCQIASHCLVPAVERLSVICACVRRKSAQCPIWRTVTSVIVASSQREMLARLALASGRRISRKISSSRRLNLDVICFSDENLQS